MSMLKPTFSLSIGSFRSSSDRAAGGPRRIVVERDMDVPADGATILLMERGDVAPGDPVTISLGHDGDDAAVFAGELVSLRPAIGGAELRAVGKLAPLLRLRAAAFFAEQSAGAIVRDLAGRAGVDVGAADDGPALPFYAVDDRVSAYAHIRELADRLGFELYADVAGALQFRALGAAAGLDAGSLGGLASGLAGALLGGGEGYAFGRHLLAAAAERRSAAWGSVEVGGESPMSGQGDRTAHWLTTEDSSYRGAAGDGGPLLPLRDPAARTRDLADRFAAGRLATAARRAHQAWAAVLGRPGLELGDTVSLSELGDGLLDVAGYVRAVRHRFEAEGGFTTGVRIGVTP